MADSEIQGLRELSADFGKIAAQALPEVDAILKKGANNVKDELVADAEASEHFWRIGQSITYDSSYRFGEAGYEIGPDKARGGKAGGAASLAHIAYFGGANGGGDTLDIDAPLKNEEPRLMAQLDKWLGGL